MRRLPPDLDEPDRLSSWDNFPTSGYVPSATQSISKVLGGHAADWMAGMGCIPNIAGQTGVLRAWFSCRFLAALLVQWRLARDLVTTSLSPKWVLLEPKQQHICHFQ